MQDSVKKQGNDTFRIQYSDYLSRAGRVQKRLHLYWSHFMKLNGGYIGICCVTLFFCFSLQFSYF